MELISDNRLSHRDSHAVGSTCAAEHQLIISSMMLLPVTAAGILLADSDGGLDVGTSSDKQARLLQAIQMKSADGPAVQAHRTGRAVMIEDLGAAPDGWKPFTERAVGFGYRSACALPLRTHEQRMGALLVLRNEAGPLLSFDVAIGQALADVAAIGILQHRSLARSELVKDQLQNALNSRVIIEQAKGVLAERGSIDVGEAFTLLRAYARNTQQRLADVARAVVEGADTAAVLEPVRPKSLVARTLLM